MQKMKNQKGVTLIALVVTVIVLMIITTLTIDVGMDSIHATKDRKYQAELEMIQQACISEYTKAKDLGYIEKPNEIPDNFVGIEVEVQDLPELPSGWAFSTEPTEEYKKYFRLTPNDLEVLNILNSENTYIVNYYTGEVYNETREESSEHVPLYIRAVVTHPGNNQVDNTTFVDDTWYTSTRTTDTTNTTNTTNTTD